MATTADQLQARIQELENRVNSLYTYIKTAAIVAAIFGITGAWGYKILQTTSQDLDKAKSSTQVLKSEVDHLGSKLSSLTDSAKVQIDDYSRTSLAQYRESLAKAHQSELYEDFSGKTLRVGRLIVQSKNGNELIDLTKSDNGSGYLGVNDSDGNELIHLTQSDNGSGYLQVNDSEGKERVRLYASQKGHGRLDLFDSEHLQTVSIGAYSKFGPFFTLSRDGENPIFSIDATESSATARIYSTDGAVEEVTEKLQAAR